MTALLEIVAGFVPLSLSAFGGPNAIVVEMQRLATANGWATRTEFTNFFAMAQAAPGPTMLVATLIGMQAEGLTGAILASLAIFLPSSIVVFAVLGVWEKFRHQPWRRVFQAALAPVTVGLSLAGASLVSIGAMQGVVTGLILLASFLLTLATRISPVLIIAAGGLVAVLLL